MRIIWFGEEDQLRIMCMKKGSNLLEVFTNLNEMLQTVESIDGIEFAKDDSYGYVTSCPSLRQLVLSWEFFGECQVFL